MHGEAVIAARRFLFDRRFDAKTVHEVADVPAEPPAPVFTLADLEQARAEAGAQGRATALAEMQAQMEAERSRDSTLLAIAERLSAIHADVHAAADQACRDAVRIAEVMVRKFMPNLYARNGASEIEALVAATLAHLPTEQAITVRVAPALTDELTPLLTLRAEQLGLGERLKVCGDATVAPGDCALEWVGGGLMRDRNSLWRDIEALIDETAGPRNRLAAPTTGEDHA